MEQILKGIHDYADKTHERKAKAFQRMKTINSDAQTVKYAEIIDNCLKSCSMMTALFLYFKRMSEFAPGNGNSDLRSATIKIVESGLKRLKLNHIK